MDRPALQRLRTAMRLSIERAHRCQSASMILPGTPRGTTLLGRACAWWTRSERLRRDLEVAAGRAPDWSSRVLVEA